MALSKRLSVVVGVLVAVATGVAIAATAWARSDGAEQKNCTIMSNLTDYSHLTIHDAGGSGMSAGDSVVYHDEIQYPSGRPAFTVEGIALVHISKADGSLSEYLAIYGDLPGGSVQGTGEVSVVGAAIGEEQTIPLEGISGSYRGETGTWKFKMVERRGPDLSVFQGTFTMCG